MRSYLFAIVGAAVASSAIAAVVHDEDVQGDLSSDPLAPTSLVLTPGVNTISGSVAASDNDIRDYFTFTIPEGQQLTGIFLIEYISLFDGGEGNTGFTHIDDGATSVIPSNATAGDFLGGSLVNRQVFPDASVNMLNTLAAAPQGGVGFVAPLGPGTYTYNIQQTGPELTGYTLDFQVVPAPGAIAMVSGLGLIVARRRR